jgi:glutathione S-transferase
MLLIGMFDSPYVRRCAISARLLGIPFDHANWSVGVDHHRICEYSPLGRVPALVLDNREVLVDSGSILDYLDELAGPKRTLLPAGGVARREAQQVIANAIGAAEKARDIIYERVVRPIEKRHEPWVTRCRQQMHGALAQVEAACARRGLGEWLVDTSLTQADITAACVYTFLSESLRVGEEPVFRYPRLKALTARCEELPEFRATHLAWFAFTA